MKKIKNFLIVLCLLFIVTACSSSGNSSSDGFPQESYDEVYQENGTTNDFTTGDKGLSNFDNNNEVTTESVEKLIQDIRITLETKEYEKAATDILSLVSKYKGYTLHSNVPQNPDKDRYSGLVANFSFMIPTGNVNTFSTDIGSIGNVTNTEKSVQNVTSSYLDAQARIKTLKAKEERLLELLDQAGKLSDLLEIERSLSDTRYQIEMYESTLKNLDQRIEYTRVDITLVEVYTYNPESQKLTLGQRIADEFKENFKDFKLTLEEFVVFVTSELPFFLLKLLILAIPLGLIYLVYSKVEKKVRKNRPKYRRITKTENDENKND